MHYTLSTYLRQKEAFKGIHATQIVSICYETVTPFSKLTGRKNDTKLRIMSAKELSKIETTEVLSVDNVMAGSNSRCESPKRGTTLSTSTSSFEALDPHDPNLSCLANTMFQKTGEYLQEELTATHADYRLLERLNKETIAKYTELKTISTNVLQSLDSLNEKYDALQPILDNINQIDDSVNKLEQAAYKLAAYSKRLQAKFKDLERDKK